MRRNDVAAQHREAATSSGGGGREVFGFGRDNRSDSGDEADKDEVFAAAGGGHGADFSHMHCRPFLLRALHGHIHPPAIHEHFVTENEPAAPARRCPANRDVAIPPVKVQG